jgi:hypothetical protein
MFHSEFVRGTSEGKMLLPPRMAMTAMRIDYNEDDNADDMDNTKLLNDPALNGC